MSWTRVRYLKNFFGRIRSSLVEFASHIPYKLAATATPAPNDLIEILNHAEYLGRMTVKEALSLWFVNDANDTQTWRLKGHAKDDFWKWVGTWAIAARKPADIGDDVPGYDLPELKIIDHPLRSKNELLDGEMFQVSSGIQHSRKIRRASIDQRVSECADIVNASDKCWIVWCDLNDESSALVKAIPGAVEIRGSDSIDKKTKALVDFTKGDIRVLVTKPSIAGHGLNWQHCSNVVFIGVGYSYEAQYQAIRRCWRYGQENSVSVHRFFMEEDQIIVDRLTSKEKTAMSLLRQYPVAG